MIGAALGLAVAFAAAPCTEALTAPPSTVSVAWVSPVRARVGRRGWLTAVATTDLRRWLGQQDTADVLTMLQGLGLRKRAKPPRRRYKVTVFEARSADLCRPLPDAPGTGEVAGVLPCDRSRSGAGTACGQAVDTRTEQPTLDVYRLRWEEAARRGFCVLPADRFVSEGPR